MAIKPLSKRSYNDQDASTVLLPLLQRFRPILRTFLIPTKASPVELGYNMSLGVRGQVGLYPLNPGQVYMHL